MKLAAGMAIAAAGVVAIAPLHAQAVIVRATGPDAPRFPVGQVLAKGSLIDLRRGSVIGLIDKAGAWELRGIVTTRIGKRPVETSSRLQLIQELVKKRKRIKRLAAVAALSTGAGATNAESARTRTGASRGPKPAAAPPPASPQIQGMIAAPTRSTMNPDGPAARIDAAWWQYPLGQSGPFCLVRGAPFELIRRAGPEEDVIVKDDRGGRILTYRFGAEAEIGYAAPSDIPVADGRVYTVETRNSVKATVRFVPIAAPAGPVALAKSLAANGCTGQIEALSRETEVTVPAG